MDILDNKGIDISVKLEITDSFISILKTEIKEKHDILKQFRNFMNDTYFKKNG